MFKKLFRVLLMASSLSNLSACVVAPPSVSIGFPPIFVGHGHGGGHRHFAAPQGYGGGRSWQRY